MSAIKTKLVAAATLVGLGGLAGWAVSQPESKPKVAAAQAAAPVEVRTQVIRRTVHIVRHQKPKRRSKPAAVAVSGSGTGGRAPVTGSSGSGASSGSNGGGAPVTRSSSSGAPASSPAPSRPVTRTSGSSGSGGSGGSRRGEDGGDGHKGGADD